MSDVEVEKAIMSGQLEELIEHAREELELLPIVQEDEVNESPRVYTPITFRQ